ncbi:hypothetical protein V3C99_003497, partial [Haemonchus contortus]
ELSEKINLERTEDMVSDSMQQ